MYSQVCCDTKRNYQAKLKQKENQIFSHASSPDKYENRNVDIEVVNPLNKKSISTFLNTHIYSSHKPDSKDIVFFHGFGLPTAGYIAFLEELSKDYNVYAVDHLGMGCSGRPEIDYFKLKATQIVDLFVSSYKSWVETMGFKKVAFICHSLGGYFSLQYASRYPQKVESIISISTPMLLPKPVGFSISKLNLPSKRKFIGYFWSFMNLRLFRGTTFFQMIPVKSGLKFWISGRTNFAEDVKEPMVDYLALQFQDLSFSGEIITELMSYLSYTDKFPLIKIVDKLKASKIPISLIFGTKDWIRYHEFKDVLKEQNLDFIKIIEVEGGTHQLPVTETKKCLDTIKDILGQN